MSKPVKIAILADAKEAVRGFGSAGAAAVDAGQSFDKASVAARQAEARLEGVGEGADTMASKGSQAAGALAGLGSLMGGPFGGAMVVGGTAMQAAADAGDLLNVAVEGGAKLAGQAMGVVKSLGQAETYAAAAKKVSAGAQWALNAAMSANPIGLIIVGIAALVAGFILAYKKSETFREIVTGAMDGARIAIGWVIDKGKDLVGWFTGLPSKIGHIASGLWEPIPNAAKAAFNGVAGFWNNTVGKISFSVPDWVPKIGGKGWSVPNIPMLAQGGIVTRPTLALIGEAGPEAVIPLNKHNTGGGDTYITLNVQVDPTHSPEEVGKTLVEYLKAYRKSGGIVRFA